MEPEPYRTTATASAKKGGSGSGNPAKKGAPAFTINFFILNSKKVILIKSFFVSYSTGTGIYLIILKITYYQYTLSYVLAYH